MGDMADEALDRIMDWDEEVINGYYDERRHPDNFEDSMVYMFPFSGAFRQRKSRGPGPCPICGAKTELKTGRFGDFYGCTKFPECKGNRNP